MVKLLACDLDGTLIIDNQLSKENKEAIKKLKKNKNLFIISTGRPLNGVEFVDEEHIDVDYYVLLNGALIVDKNKNIILKKEINFNKVKDIVEKYNDEKVLISMETGMFTYLYKKENFNLKYGKKKLIDNIKEIEDKSISLISIQFIEETIEKINKYVEELNFKYSDIIAYRNMNFIDIVPNECSKGIGVEEISKLENIEKKDIYTIGDSWNDLSMFKISKNSFTFKNSDDGLKKEVSNIVNSVHECINNYILK